MKGTILTTIEYKGKQIPGVYHRYTNDLVHTEKGWFMWYDKHYRNGKLYRRQGYYPFNFDNDTNYIRKTPIKTRKYKNLNCK